MLLWLLQPLSSGTGSASFSCEGSDSKYFRLQGTSGLWPRHDPLLLQGQCNFSLQVVHALSPVTVSYNWYVVDIFPSSLDSSLCFIQPGILHHVLCTEIKYAGWRYTALKYSFPNFEPVCCSLSGSTCCFLTCIQVSQEAGKVVWYSHLFKNFPVCCNPHKGFDVVNKAEVDVFLELSCYFWWFLFIFLKFLAIYCFSSLLHKFHFPQCCPALKHLFP